MKRNNGSEFESLTELVFTILYSASSDKATTVERNVLMDGPDGRRQVDVVARTKAGPFDLVTIFSCKDHKKKIKVSYIDEIHSLMEDVRANKAVVVSRKGFSKTSRQKATRLGVALYSLDHVDQVTDEIVSVPILVKEITPGDFYMEGEIYVPEPTNIDGSAFMRLNDLDVAQLLRDEVLSSVEIHGKTAGIYEWHPKGIEEPCFIRDIGGNRIAIRNVKISYQLLSAYYFGYLNELQEVIRLKDEVEDSKRIFFKAEEILPKYKTDFARYEVDSQLPAESKVTLSVVALPTAINTKNIRLTSVPTDLSQPADSQPLHPAKPSER